ncbi:MAG: tRNA (adenosine(37)-N6)-dimethylallyltransferase MiaA [Bacillota bacterium]
MADRKVLVIAGPTATGKSAMSLDLAERFPIEVISADSMQVYRGMDIGTDKVSPEDRARVRHHLIDVKDPDEPWSVEEFKSLASRAIEDISERGGLPCVVGGTGLYIRALLRDFPLQDAPPDWDLRQSMAQLAAEKGNQAVHALLRTIDPVSYRTLHPNDQKRVIRALEYHKATGRPISERLLEKPVSPYDSLWIGISWNRQLLDERIDNRVEDQWRRGFVQEVRGLLEKDYSEDLASMQGLGYKEVCLMLQGLLTPDEAKALIKRNTRRYCKRQLTWFSREEGINWVSAGNDIAWRSTVEAASNLCKEWLGE